MDIVQGADAEPWINRAEAQRESANWPGSRLVTRDTGCSTGYLLALPDGAVIDRLGRRVVDPPQLT